MHVVVCGGGVIGSAIAYQLSERNVSTTVIERWRVGGGASGKSGGFLARDWCDRTPVEQLAHRSFDLHAVWAETLGNPYGYRTVDTYSAVMRSRSEAVSGDDTQGVALWLSHKATHRNRLGTTTTTAQLDPEAFTRTLLDAACAGTATLRHGTVAKLTFDTNNRVTGAALSTGETVKADAVIIALGPWSLLAAQWIPLPPVYGLKGHSIVFEPDSPLPAEAVFADFEAADGDQLTPEIVPRADGTLYICGLSGNAALPIDPADVAPEPGGCEKLRDIAVTLVPQLASARILAQQACYRPIAPDGLPLIGPVPGYRGAYVATAHSVWGMLNAPGTGEAIAELITTGTSPHVDLTPFALDRLDPLDPADLELGS